MYPSISGVFERSGSGPPPWSARMCMCVHKLNVKIKKGANDNLPRARTPPPPPSYPATLEGVKSLYLDTHEAT